LYRSFQGDVDNDESEDSMTCLDIDFSVNNFFYYTFGLRGIFFCDVNLLKFSFKFDVVLQLVKNFVEVPDQFYVEWSSSVLLSLS
jgi:hypothetical protein